MANPHPLIQRARKELAPGWRGGREEVAEFLSAHVNSVTRWVREGVLDYDASEGRRRLVSRWELIRFLREFYTSPKRPKPGRKPKAVSS